jgi:hypothetical protein
LVSSSSILSTTTFSLAIHHFFRIETVPINVQAVPKLCMKPPANPWNLIGLTSLKLDQILFLLPTYVTNFISEITSQHFDGRSCWSPSEALNHLEVKWHWIKHMPQWLPCLMCHWCYKHLPCPVPHPTNSQHFMRHSHYPFFPLNWFCQHNTDSTFNL